MVYLTYNKGKLENSKVARCRVTVPRESRSA